MSRRWRYPRSRRGSFYKAVPAAVAASAPSYVPGFQEPSGRNSRLVATRVRRGQFLTVPRRVCPIVAPVRRTRARVGAPRRGEFFTVPLVGLAPTAPTWVPTRASRRAPVRPVRRGEFFPIPLVGAAPTPVQLAPAFTRQAAHRLGATRRGHYFPGPYAGAAPVTPPWVPTIVRQAAHRYTGTRRGRYLFTPRTGRQAPPQFTRSHVRTAPVRRGSFTEPPWAQPQTQATWAPVYLVGHRARGFDVRAGRTWATPSIVATVPPAPFTPAVLSTAETRHQDGTAVTRNTAGTATTRTLDGTATTQETA